jgi:hypothetical protein
LPTRRATSTNNSPAGPRPIWGIGQRAGHRLRAQSVTLPICAKTSAASSPRFRPRSKERPEELADEGELDLLIATDCISEGQNLQDCDWLINYDIHWNPVRIIQRFGRIDRIGSTNSRFSW